MGRRYGWEIWQRHLEAWRQSALTQDAYCELKGLSVKTFYRWHRKEKEAKAAQSALTLVPVNVELPTAGLPGNLIRIFSPGGWRIEVTGSSIVGLAELLRQLP
jgi:hypothetical protein